MEGFIVSRWQGEVRQKALQDLLTWVSEVRGSRKAPFDEFFFPLLLSFPLQMQVLKFQFYNGDQGRQSGSAICLIRCCVILLWPFWKPVWVSAQFLSHQNCFYQNRLTPSPYELPTVSPWHLLALGLRHAKQVFLD